jgi:hypothetical protein
MGEPLAKISTGSSPAPKAATRTGAGAKKQKSTSRASAVLGLEADVMVKAPSESHKFRMVAKAAAQAVRDERAQAKIGGKRGAGAAERRGKAHQQPEECDTSAEEGSEEPTR